ncbi:hypothetical protein HYW46_04530 [Candidatus Daviesbacteria bacterium]|nr:hypothetical protein [Candidatus Daviesbacteria bacterium]
MFAEQVKEYIAGKILRPKLVRPLLVSLLAGTMLVDSSPASANPSSFTATINCEGTGGGDGFAYIVLPDRQEKLECANGGDKSQSKTFSAETSFAAEVGYLYRMSEAINGVDALAGWYDYEIRENPEGGLEFWQQWVEPPAKVPKMSVDLWTRDAEFIVVDLDLRKN